MSDPAPPKSRKRRHDVAQTAEPARDSGASEREVPQFAMVSCFDESDRLTEVDTRLLAPFACRLYKQIKYDPPSVVPETGRHFWRCGMTRAMLQTFLRSLQHGELSLSKTVSVAEAMTTFEFENVSIGVPSERRGDTAAARVAFSSVRPPPTGVVFPKRLKRINEVVLTTSEQVAHAIARWPRLENTLDAALRGAAPSTSTTATRAWVRFCRKPARVFVAERSEPVVAVARKWPQWLQSSMVSLGILFAKLHRAGRVASFLHQWDEQAFNALVTLVQGDQLGWFLFTVHDYTRKMSDKYQRRDTTAGEQFAARVRQTILEGADGNAAVVYAAQLSAPEMAERTQALGFARACVTLAEQVLHDAPSPAIMYSGVCTEDNGKTSERTQLQRSLAQRGIKLVRWCEGDEKGAPAKPLVFPPMWAEGASSSTSSTCMLLEFSEGR